MQAKNTASTWTVHLSEFNLKCKVKNNFGFILTAKRGFLVEKLNLSFGLRAGSKNSSKIKKKF